MFTVRRLVITLLLAVAAVLLGLGFSMSGDETDTVGVTDVAVEALIPPPGDLELRQSEIGVDLVPGYTGVLVVDGREIPEDQLRRIDALNQVFYTPGPETETGPLTPGRHRVTAIFWPANRTREAARRVSWEFNVH